MATIEASGPDDLGPALREVRLADELTQSELAARAKVGRQWLNEFELGDKPAARLDMVMRVADSLGVDVLLRRPERPERARTARAEIDLDALLRGYDR